MPVRALRRLPRRLGPGGNIIKRMRTLVIMRFMIVRRMLIMKNGMPKIRGMATATCTLYIANTVHLYRYFLQVYSCFVQ